MVEVLRTIHTSVKGGCKGIKIIEDRITRVGFQLNSYASNRLKRTSKRMRE